jgi:tryptophan-rich sensory protein
VCRRKKAEANPLLARLKLPLAAVLVTTLATSVSGVVIATIKGIDPAAGAQDSGAMIILLLMAAMIFTAALWFRRKPENRKLAFLCACYFINALPTVIYSYLTGSPFRSPVPLLTAIAPTLITWLIVRRKQAPKTPGNGGGLAAPM